jgi:hypothetical protein
MTQQLDGLFELGWVGVFGGEVVGEQQGRDVRAERRLEVVEPGLVAGAAGQYVAAAWGSVRMKGR